MKKCLLLLAAGLLSIGASAQTAETLKVALPAYPWKVAAGSDAPATVNFTQGYALFNLIANGFSVDTYTGYKLEYTALSSTDNIQLKISTGNDATALYPAFTAESGTLEGTFDGLTGWISTLGIQTKEGVTGSITITKFSLIKADGTADVASYYGTGWGYEVSQEINTLNFTGQYGFALITRTDGSACTYDPETDPKGQYTFTIELEEAAPSAIGFEADYWNPTGGQDGKGGDEGLIWASIAAGSKTATLIVNADKCDGKAVSNIYVKSSKDNDNGEYYSTPVSIKIKSVTRAYTTNKTSDEFAYHYKFPLVDDYVILKEYLDKFDDTDLAIFTYSCSWDGSTSYNNWGVCGLKNPEVEKVNECFIFMPIKHTTGGSYDYSFSTTIGAIQTGVGHHDAETATEANPNADTEEWDGVRWESWGGSWNPPVTCTKLTFMVHSDKTVKFTEEEPEALRPVSGATVVSSEVFTLTGEKVAAPVRGVNIIRQTLSDGTSRTDRKSVV